MYTDWHSHRLAVTSDKFLFISASKWVCRFSDSSLKLWIRSVCSTRRYSRRCLNSKCNRKFWTIYCLLSTRNPPGPRPSSTRPRTAWSVAPASRCTASSAIRGIRTAPVRPASRPTADRAHRSHRTPCRCPLADKPDRSDTCRWWTSGTKISD